MSLFPEAVSREKKQWLSLTRSVRMNECYNEQCETMSFTTFFPLVVLANVKETST